MSIFKSQKGDIPEIDPSRFEQIVSLVTTFESNDLHTRNVINFAYDESSDYVFLEMLSTHNGQRLIDYILGYDKDKIVNVCEQILTFFKNKRRTDG